MNTPSRHYAWLMLAGIGVSLFLWYRLARRDARLVPIYLGGLFGAAIGAKLLYLLAEGWLDYGQPDQWLRWATGKTVLGALAGGYGGVELAKRWVGYPLATGDLFASVAPVGIILGRVGCLLQGCCLGAVCEHSAWWTLADRHGHPRWPAVPAEIAFNVTALAAFAVLRARRLLTGQHFHLYLIGYGAFRFAHEFWRDTPRIALGLSGYQFASLALVGFAAWRFRQRSRRLPLLTPPQNERATPLALLGICQRTIRTQRTPDCGRKQRRKAFPVEVKSLGDVLRKRRSEQRLNQRELAAILQISRDRIQAWERDETAPSTEEWEKLVKLLNLPATAAEVVPNSGV